MGERLTRAQAAERKGVSRQRIDELINEGKLREERATVDADELDELWNTFDVSYTARHHAGKAARAPIDEEESRLRKLLNKAKTQDAVLKAQEREIELKVRRGQLVDKQMVTQQAYTVAKKASTQLQNLPRQLAAQLAVLTDPAEVEEVLARSINTIISEIRNELASLR